MTGHHEGVYGISNGVCTFIDASTLRFCARLRLCVRCGRRFGCWGIQFQIVTPVHGFVPVGISKHAGVRQHRFRRRIRSLAPDHMMSHAPPAERPGERPR